MKPSFLKSIAIVLTLAVAPLTISNAQAAVKIGSYIGNWKPSITYAGGDLITYSNKTFLSLAKNKAKNPNANPKVWQVLGGVGEDGVGVTGPQGIQGLSGLNGLQGTQGDKGDTGVIGPRGDTGVIGPRGAPGITQAGTNIGDMQYWDGITWMMIPAPAFKSTTIDPPEMATLHFCSNSLSPTWKVVCDPIPPPIGGFLIGDTGPAGGKVFYLTDATKAHGLEAAPVDQSVGVQWGCLGVPTDGSFGNTGYAVGTGKTNTQAINAVCGTGTAAQIAANYSLNGFTDWYLPSEDELNLLYNEKIVVGGFANYSYWSSTESGPGNARRQDFVYGNQNYASKSSILFVRAIRTF